MFSSCSLSAFKAVIHEQLGHSPGTQKLLLGATPLLDENTSLEDLGFANRSVLTLVTVEPLGQSFYETESGNKRSIDRNGKPSEALNEFELRSWHAAREGDRTHNGVWSYAGDGEDDSWTDEGVDFYWTLRSDGCRYEYWSTAPGDNEYGILVRIDATSMKAVGEGSDDGLELFKEGDMELKSLLDLKRFVGGRFHEDEDEDEDESESDEE